MNKANHLFTLSQAYFFYFVLVVVQEQIWPYLVICSGFALKTSVPEHHRFYAF